MTISMAQIGDTRTGQVGTIMIPPSPGSTFLPRSEYRPERLLDSAEAAAILGIHPKTLQRMARSGQIRGIRVGRLWRFRRSDIDEWIERGLAC
jgi:excisionase family DNA binding protein